MDMAEKIQRRFRKCLLGIRQLSYSDRLQVIGLLSLERRRLRIYLILVYSFIYLFIYLSVKHELHVHKSSSSTTRFVKTVACLKHKTIS